MKTHVSTGFNKIYYSAPGNTEGLSDVFVTLIQHDGTVLLNEVSMTELGDGVYEYDFNFPTEGWYIATSNSTSLGGIVTESIRIADPSITYIYGTCPSDSTNVFEVNRLDGSNVINGYMTQINTTGIFWADVTAVTNGEYFFKMNGWDTAKFEIPLNQEQVIIDPFSLVLEKGFNIAAYSGSGKYNFDSTAGDWVYTSEDIENTKAEDIYKTIIHDYPGVTVKYIKAYEEQPIGRFRVYIPDFTPPTNVNNFPLIQINQITKPEQNAFYVYLEMTQPYIVIKIV